jgi:catechol 2,3-dioxygenase-like lactoylglutathione lyase family enzyme
MTLKRMDNVLIVVDDLEAAKAFFIELGLKLESETTVEGPSVGSRRTTVRLRHHSGRRPGPDLLCGRLDLAD